jgi:hypothetical protein
MDEMTTRVTIEPAQNGFRVYLNDFPTGLSVRKVPYVFETMDNLLEFIKTKLV